MLNREKYDEYFLFIGSTVFFTRTLSLSPFLVLGWGWGSSVFLPRLLQKITRDRDKQLIMQLHLFKITAKIIPMTKRRAE
jgi:hypothetical protein